MSWTSDFFTQEEMACKCAVCKSVLTADHFESSLKLARALDVVRRIFNVPMTITSAGRCMAHHKKIYKDLGISEDKIPKLSEHLFFRAADIKMRAGTQQLTGLEMKGMFETLIKLKHVPNGGLGTYPDRPHILHYDHGEIRRWSK